MPELLHHDHLTIGMLRSLAARDYESRHLDVVDEILSDQLVDQV